MPATKAPVSKATVEKILSEEPEPLKQARYYFPQRPDLSTMHRWRTRGLGGVKLTCIRSGGVWVTSRAEAVRFMQACSAS